ncbi:Baculoviral IAP repeat-containing protein [Dirofilaria immitis]
MAKDGKRNGRILLSQQCSIHGPIETHRHKAFVQNITCKKSEITIFIVGRRYDHDDLTEMMKPCEMCPMCGFGSCRMCGHGSCRMCGHTARKISNNWKMNNNPVRCVAAALTDLIHCDNVSTPDNTEERFIVVPIVELPLNYSALNSPEIVYLDGTNQILLRCMNGLTMIFDATFENTSPLATYRLNPNARIIYNKNSGTLAIADSKMLCLRQDYGGTFLLKTALKRPSNKTVFVELPLDEATKFLQIVTNDSDSEDILKQRPALRKFISHLRTTVANIPANTMESVVVETNGKELLEQLRPLEIPGENNNSEVPPEWLTFIWPYISALGERVRLMLNPDHPYNFEYSPEWKGLNKEIMASEAARRLTFQNWPHMEYRWALPCQMAEAGFYHQPNSAGDDRVLCFSCFVCLVCWEPSDEPWSEHERHSPKCRFVHNYTNPNVPLVLTMSALSPFTHHMQVNHTSSLVFSTGSGDWIAVANKESAEVHLWRMGSVVQMKQCISLNSEKFFSAILDCVTIEGDQPPRRTQRVTWSDDLTNCLVNTYVDEAQQVNTIKESSSDECLLKPALTALLIDANCEIVITALCTVGRSCLDDSSIGTVTRESSEQKQTLVIVSISVNDAKLNKVRQQSQGSLETEINTLNTMNRVHEFIDMSPRIVSESCFVDDGINSGASLRPFVVLYQLDCTNSFSSRERISPARQENSKLIRNKMMNSSNANTDSTEGILLTNTTDDTLLEWSDSAYDEHSGFIDLSTGEENLALGGSSKTKYDEKTSYISVNYEAPSMDISFVQCFRLPSAIDNTSMEISAIIPMQNIFVVVVVNNIESTLDDIQSAILIYLIHFGKIAMSIQTEPLKVYYYKDFRISQFSLANMDLVHTNSESFTSDYFDGGVIRTMEDMVYFINLNTNKLYSLCDERVAQFAVMDNGKVTLLTRNSRKLITVQIAQSNSRRTDYEEDEDTAVAALFSKMSDSQQLESPKNIDREAARNLLSGGNNIANVTTAEYLSTAGLRRIWKLTRNDIGGPVRGGTYRLPCHFGGQPGYNLVAPSGWSEVPANQRIRKHFIENTPIEGVSQTWFYQSDCIHSNDLHIFELLHFQHGLRISHVDIFLNFHETCLACPDIELRLYRRKTNAGDVSSSLKIHSQTSFSGSANLEEIESQCDLLAGPYHCAEYADLIGHSAKVQLPGIVFLPQLLKKGGNIIGFKSVSFYLVLRALSDSFFDHAVTAVERDKDKLEAASIPGKTKSSSKRRIDAREFAEPSQSSITTTGDSSTYGLTRHGIQWIDELVITVVKSKRAIEPNERIERRALIETTNLHNNIVMLAAGIAPKISSTQKIRTEGEKLQQQSLALDIIEWLIDNWVNTSSQINLSAFAEMIIENVDAIFVNCFIISQRSISHRWSTILMYLLRVLRKSDGGAFSKLLQIFLSCSIRIVTNLHAVKNAGSLHWLFVFIFALLKVAVMTNDVSCIELLSTLLNTFISTLTFVGIAWKQCWNGSVHDKLATEYNLSGLPTELVMYEWPRSVLSLWQRHTAAKVNDPNELAHATAFPPPTPTVIAQKWASTAASYGKGYSEIIPSQNVGMTRYEKISTADTRILNKDCVDTNTNINGLTAENEMDWLTLFNISTDYAKETSGNLTEVNTEVMMDRFLASSAANSQRQEYKYHAITTSTQLSGLLETEPLTFTVVYASDHVKVENMETGFITEIDCASAPIGHTENEGPIPLKIMDITQTILNKKSDQNTGNDSGFLKPGLQNLSADLNARMTLIAMEQERTKEDNTVGNSEQSSHAIAQGFATQGSSASTFGIPTTPKTTPFMTPTPLSPSHLSPINSESNLAHMVENESASTDKESQETSNKRTEIYSQIPSLIPMISPDIFKLPSQKFLLMEKISFGSRKFVILDFGMPILLTDLFIPSVAEIAAISIDVWLLGENVDGQRLLMTTDICRKSIAVQDLQPFMRIRFIKITYIGRRLYNATCKIPIGLFFGHRFFPSWQVHSYPFMQKETHSVPTTHQKKMAVTLNHLRQLCENLRCRHQLVSTELRRLVDESASEEEVKQVYRECVQLSLQWNIVVGVVHRLELDHLPSYDSEQNLEKVLHGNWSDCCPDQLQIIAVELFALVTQAIRLIDVWTVALETFADDNKISAQNCHPSEAKYARIKFKETLEVNLLSPLTEEIILQPKFSLDDAVILFVLFCVPSVPRLQVGCITWLFHQGSESEWWPLFFPRVLKEIFSTQPKKYDYKIFLQLSFLCNHSVKSSSKQSVIILELFNLIKEIAVNALDNYIVDYQSPNNFNVTLLCWSLMLLSSAFDVIAYNKKKNDRWAFIGGEYLRVMPSNEKDDSASRWHKKKLLKFGDSDEKTTESLKNISSATLKAQLETLWEKHLKMMEAMKANMKISKALNVKMQKKIEMEKKIYGFSPPDKMGHSAFAESDFSTELTEKLHATMLPFLCDQQIEEILAKKCIHQQNSDLKTSIDSSESALKKAISKGNKSNSRSRCKQHSIRLRLPQEPCIDVARKLIMLLCDFEKQLPILIKLIICKVVARICISASHHIIPLTCVLEGPVDKLIKIGLEEQGTGLLKYAVLYLLLDVIEAESRAVSKSNAFSKNQVFIKTKGSKTFEISEELDLLCVRHTGCHFVDIILRAKSMNEVVEDVKERKSTGITAAVCCLPEAFCGAKTSRSFSIANYDEQPKLGSELLEKLIYQLLINTRQAVVPDGPNDEIRSYAYQKKAKEIIKEKLAKGERFCYVFRWVDDLLEADELAARSCNGDVESYLKLMETHTSSNTTYERYTTTSQSAFIACCISEHMRYESSDGLTSSLSVVEPRSGSLLAPKSPLLCMTDIEMKEGKHKMAQNENEDVEVMKNTAVSQDIPEVASCVLGCEHSEADFLNFAIPNNEISMEMEPCSSVSSVFSKYRMKDTEKWVPMKWSSKISVNREIYVEHIMASFLSELRLARSDILIQPCSFTYPDYLTQKLGLNQHIHCMNMDFLADIITRHSVQNLSRWRTCFLCRHRLPEDETMCSQLGDTLNATNAALGRFVQSISPGDSDQTVQELLTFCMDFEAGLIYSTEKLPAAGKCILPAENITAIVNFVVVSNSLSEHLWVLVLRILDLIVKNDSTAPAFLIESPHFCKFISNFLVKSISKVNQALTTGPSVIYAFKNFITRLHGSHNISLRSILCVKILTVLKNISSQQDDLINFSYPIDCLVELLNIMTNYASDYANVAPQELAGYISSSIHAARNFIRYYKTSGGYSLVSADSYLRPNTCFQAAQKIPINVQYVCENTDLPNYPYMTEQWGQCGPHYSQLSDFVDPKRSLTIPDDSLNCLSLLPRWQNQSNMFRQIMLNQVACYLNCSSEVSDHLLSNFPVAIEELFEIVAACESAVPDVTLISLEDWNQVTLGDQALSILLQISRRVSRETKRLFEIAVQVIKRCSASSRYALSKPLTFAFVQMLGIKHNQIYFAQLGGYLIVARELERSILASTNDWTAPISAPFMQQLASLSAQVAGSNDYGWRTSKLQTDVRDDGLYNYAPFCTISSEQTPNVSGQLLSLISVAAPRRTRSANWSYHFNEDSGEWFDIILNLPYHINLHEIQIRPHVPALSTAPAAVQVELCSEASLTQWYSLGTPFSTIGYSKIRISTDSYKLPVIAVRLYFKKPPDSTNLSLSQILLLGINFTASLSYTCPKNTDFVQWLSIMVQLCNLEKYCVWQYAPELPRALIALFLGRPLSNLVYHRISELFCQIDHERAKPYSIVELIFQYIEQGSTVTSESLEWLPNLLFTLCAHKSSLLGVSPARLQKDHQFCIRKQCQLLFGITCLITSRNYKEPLQDVAAVLIWTASCIIWHNINVEERHLETLALCMDLTPQLLPLLCKMAMDVSEQCNDTLAKSVSWLLCSLMRGAPHLLHNALKEIGLLDINDKPKREGITQNAFTVVQRMCQSRTSILQLHSFGLLQYWVELIIAYCEETNMEHISLLVSIVRCLASLCCIEDVVKFLDFIGGSRLFNSLIKCVVRCAASPGDVTHLSGKQSIKLEDATISLLSQCVTVGGSHRQRIAHVLCSLLKSAGNFSGAIQQMVLKCIFDDEMIPVKAVDEDTSICFLSFDIPNRILHPFFGCTRREHFLKVSLYTSLDEISALCQHKNTNDFRQLAKIAAPMDEFHRFLSVVNNRDLTAAFPSIISSRLLVRNYDGLIEMMGDWKIGQLLGDLFISGRLTSSAWKQKMAGEDIAKIAVQDSADGYYTVALSFVQRSGLTDTGTVLRQKPDVMLTEQTSTLQYFARASGLALLALHLQIHHPTFNVHNAIPSFRESKGKSAEQWLIDSSETITTNEISSYACPASIFSSPDISAGEPVYSTLYVPVFGGETDLGPSYEDFEYIDSTTPGEVKGWTYYPLFSQTDNSGNHATPKKLQKIGSQLSNRVLSIRLSPHVIVAFSIFLRLEGYAELLVTYDRKRAKSLLRLAMGVMTAETSPADKPQMLKPGVFHRAIQSQSQSKQKSECENLGLLPFVVLEELFNKYSPCTADGRSLREAAVTNGILDILLDCLAHYSHQKHKEKSIRPSSLPPTPEAAVLVERLLRGSLEPEQSSGEETNFALTAEERVNNSGNVGPAVNSSSNIMQQHNFWAKGTGFGSGTTQQQWNVDLHVLKRKQDEQNVTHLLRVLSSFIYPKINEHLDKIWSTNINGGDAVASGAPLDPEAHVKSQNIFPMFVSDPSMPGPSSKPSFSSAISPITVKRSLSSAVIRMISRSCLLPALRAYLRNDSVLDISQHVELYEAVVYMVAALALSPEPTGGKQKEEDEITALFSEPESGYSMHAMLKNLFNCVSAYLTRLAVESSEARMQSLNVQQTTDNNEESAQVREEGLMRLAPLITTVCMVLSRRVKELPVKSQNNEKDAVTEEERYMKVMKALQFETISFFAEGSFIPYHYESSLSSIGTSSLGKRTRRLAQEIVTLSNSLPLSLSSSVFVRACEERLDIMKVLITGPADTPYMNGCFEFDVWFPTDYPNSPMHVNLETTGNHTVRFNPNLYNDGKVCLSVLNTWHGRPEERWNPETSSLLQVIVSVQSLILVAEPYFNEPGYERSKYTQAGQQASRDYDANIRQAVVKWAMLEMIRHPPPAFADIVKKHFWLKRKEILLQISKWIAEMEQLVKQRGSGRSIHGHLASLKRHAAALEDEYRRMECPVDIQNINASLIQQISISENKRKKPTVNEQQSQIADASEQIPHDNLKNLSTMKILKL